MKTKILTFTNSIATLLLSITLCSTANAQNDNLNASPSQVPYDIISQSMSNNVLWQESTLSFNSVPTLYVLNHGVELDLPSNLVVSGKPVVLINKGDINALGNPPYFLFHTLKIDEVKAFVRIYLSYDVNGERTTKNEELYFVKTQNGWEVSNNQL